MDINELKKQIFAADDIKIKKLIVPEWGDAGNYIYGKALSGAQLDKYEIDMVNIKGAKISGVNSDNVRAKLLVKTLVNESGVRIFTKKEDVEALGEKSGDVLDRLFDEIRELSGMTRKAKEELEKNLQATPDEDAISG